MKRCKQCGAAKADNGWTICGGCERKNIEYREQCEKQAYAVCQQFALSPPSRMMPPELRRPSEMRGRKSRSAKIAAETWEDKDE